MDREAAARCPGCRRYFCRECVTEHQGRVSCAECLARAVAAPRNLARTRTVRSTMFAAIGFVLSWVLFYYLGAYLSQLPASLHGGGLE